MEGLAAHLAEPLPVGGDIGIGGGSVPVGLPADRRPLGEQPVLAGEVRHEAAGVGGGVGTEGGALVARLGARTVCAARLALIAAALAVLAQLNQGSGLWLLAVGLIPLGAGMGLATTPATSGITAALPAARQGVGSALNDLSRETGGAVGIAVLGSVLTATYQSHLNLARLPAAEGAGARSSVAVAVRLGGVVTAHAQTAFADGMQLALLIAAGIVAAAAVIVAVLMRPGASPAQR